MRARELPRLGRRLPRPVGIFLVYAVTQLALWGLHHSTRASFSHEASAAEARESGEVTGRVVRRTPAP